MLLCRAHCTSIMTIDVYDDLGVCGGAGTEAPDPCVAVRASIHWLQERPPGSLEPTARGERASQPQVNTLRLLAGARGPCAPPSAQGHAAGLRAARRGHCARGWDARPAYPMSLALSRWSISAVVQPACTVRGRFAGRQLGAASSARLAILA